MTHRALTFCLIAPLLGGCDGDSLASGERLEQLMGQIPMPDQPAFELRWFMGPDEGLLVDCDLQPTEIGNDEEALLGSLTVELASEPEPPVWLHTNAGYSWAVALVVLVDGQRYEQPDTGDGADLDVWRGVWGVAARNALLVVDGDLEMAQQQLLVVPDDADPLEGSHTWVELLPAVVAANDDFRRGISLLTGPLSDEGEEEEWGDQLTITSMEWLEDEVVLGVVSGESINGAQLDESCR